MDNIDGFPYIETSLHPWDVAYFIMLNDHFDVFFESVGKNFIVYFCIDVHKENMSKVSFVGSLCGFGISEIVAS